MCRLLTTMIIVSCTWCIPGSTDLLSGQEPSEVKLKKLADDSRSRAEAVEVRVRKGTQTTKALLHATPLMKYTDVPRQIEMATLWIWEHDGQPVALGKVEAYRRKDGTKWLYCFASASTGLVDGKWPDGRRFEAQKPGVEWAVLDATAPKDTTAARVRHMKELFGRFTATVRDDVLKTSDELRPLARPLHEYSSTRHGVAHGVLCGFAANGTNPDVIVALEALSGEGKNDPPKSWRYAVLGMTTRSAPWLDAFMEARHRVQRAAVENGRCGLGLAFIHHPQNHPQIVGDLLEHPSGNPPSRLLVHRRRRRKVVRQEVPLAPRFHNVPQGIKDVTQRVIPLRCVFTHKSQVRNQKLPLGIRNIARIRLPCHAHEPKMPTELTISR